MVARGRARDREWHTSTPVCRPVRVTAAHFERALLLVLIWQLQDAL